MIAGSGTSVLLKSATIRQTVRENNASRSRGTTASAAPYFKNLVVSYCLIMSPVAGSMIGRVASDGGGVATIMGG